jgi:arylesterase/paraoxonase
LRKLFIIILSFVLIAAVLGFKTYYQSGAFRTITNKFQGTVKKMGGVSGVEDITVDQSTGIAFLSSMDRWREKQGNKTRGAIYSLNLNDSTANPENLTTNLVFEFMPHGISLFHSPTGKTILFAINHRRDGNYIEVFEYRNDSLIHRESISDPLMISPNDVVGVGERSFYFTNDHNEKASSSRLLKDLLAMGTGEVIYYAGGKAVRTSVEGIQYANGINVNAEGTQVYVASTTGKEIIVCDRDVASGSLREITRVPCGTGVDNIEIDGVGDLWVGCHPQMLKFLSHSKDENTISPSEVIKVSAGKDGKFNIETMYMNDGSEISASSVAAPYKNRLLIGPVFQRHILLTTLN